MNYSKWRNLTMAHAIDELIEKGFLPSAAETLVGNIGELMDEAYQYGRKDENDGRED